MKVFLPLTLLLLVMLNISSIDCLTLTERYFLTMDLSSTVAPVNIRKALEEIQNTLCSPKSDSLKCYLKFKVVGEARVIFIVDVKNSAELKRRLWSITASRIIQIESEPIVDYDRSAKFLGVDESLIKVDRNVLKKSEEVLWCEININFGDKNQTELIALWKAEAEIVIKTRNAGIPLELFKTLGEQTVHLLTERGATEFDQRLFATPFYQEIHSTLKTTCKTIVTF